MRKYSADWESSNELTYNAWALITQALPDSIHLINLS